MLGLKILRHAIQMVLRNYKEALRIGGVPILGFMFGSVIIGLSVPKFTDGNQMVLWSIYVTIALLAMVIFVFPRIAVAWHRFVLRGEYPTGFLPAWSGSHTWGYLKKSALLLVLAVVVTVLSSVVFIVVFGLFSPGHQQQFQWVLHIIPVFAGLLATYVALRLSLVLPAVALGESAYYSQSWEETGQIKGAIVAFAMTLGIANGIESFLSTGIPYPALSLAVDIVWVWFSTMVGISFLTTVYGYLFEDRPLT